MASLTDKQKEIMELVDKCGFVTTPYDSRVLGIAPTGGHIYLKLAKNALLRLVACGELVASYNRDLMTTRYVKGNFDADLS